jgi:hypothetical protein
VGAQGRKAALEMCRDGSRRNAEFDRCLVRVQIKQHPKSHDKSLLFGQCPQRSQ